MTGRVAVVTGGGRGIGRAIAGALGAAGARVAVTARSAPELEETAALVPGARAYPADVTDEAAIRGVFQSVERDLGPVDVLVNNAGVLGPIAPFCQTPTEAWWQTIDVNVRGPMLCTHAVLPGMIERRRGTVVNIASGAGAMATPHFSAYGVSKTALIRFTESLAAEARPYGVALFAINPGPVGTRMSDRLLDSEEGRQWIPWYRRLFDEGFDQTPEATAQLAVRLASGAVDALSGLLLSPLDDLDAILKVLDEVKQKRLYSLRVRPLAGPVNPKLAAIRDAAEGR